MRLNSTTPPKPQPLAEQREISCSAGDDANDTNRAVVYFDGSCPLCSAEIRHYAFKDSGDQLCFVDVSQANPELGSDLLPELAVRRFHVRLPDGTLASGARGFVALWDTLPGWRWVAKIARLPGVTPMLELAYRMFLPVRPLLSRVAARLGAKPLSRQEMQSSGVAHPFARGRSN